MTLSSTAVMLMANKPTDRERERETPGKSLKTASLLVQIFQQGVPELRSPDSNSLTTFILEPGLRNKLRM